MWCICEICSKKANQTQCRIKIGTFGFIPEMFLRVNVVNQSM